MKKQNKGITLVALVVTIIVLIILAGVSISLVLGENGIITKTKYAKQETLNAEVSEQEQLNEAASYLESLGGTKPPKEDDNLQETIAGKTYNTETDIVVGQTKVTIPAGATISAIPGEYEDVKDGLVIYIMKDADGDNKIDTPNWEDVEYMQETYDQFVWVPVPNAITEDINEDGNIDETDIDEMIEAKKYPMAIETGTTIDDEGKTVTNYRGVFYIFDKIKDAEGNVTEVGIRDKFYSATSGYREPIYYYDSYNNVTPNITQDLLQEEFNTMVTKVNENKGFWVGRYETSNMNGGTEKRDNTYDETQQVSVIKGTTTGICFDSTVPNYINWYRMYAQQKNYSNLVELSATSSMIWGSQWDQIMIWMKDEDNESQNSKYIVNSLGMANLGERSGVDDGYSDTEKPARTGCFEVRNVYDLAGNLRDWTLEAYDSKYRVCRGGSCYDMSDSSISAECRQHNNSDNEYSLNGSRAVLY